ncbi:MAG: hypothetical protein ACRC6V_01645 [Bacteroidales bacterium]
MQVVSIPSTTSYFNVYNLSGYASTKSLILTNNTSSAILVIQASTPPLATTDAFPLYLGQTILVQGTSDPIWVKGGSGPLVVQDYSDTIIPFSSIDPRVYAGTQAITMQPFAEANCKNGVQFEVSSYAASVAGGATTNAILISGSKPVLLKSRQISFTGTGVTADVFINPVYSGGSTVPIYNMRLDGLAVATTVQVIGGVTVSNTGTLVAAPTYGIGTSSQGSNTSGTFSGAGVTGVERVIPPNTTLLLRITNRNSSACQISTYATWYEGALSVTM